MSPVLLTGPMMCGMFLCYFKQLDGETLEFADLFKGFDYFLPGLLVAVIKIAVCMVLMVPLFFILISGSVGLSTLGENNAAAGSAFGLITLFFMFVTAVLLMLVGVFLMFCYPLVVSHKLDAVAAVKASIKGAKANFWGLIFFSIVAAIFCIIAACLCFFPIYLAVPIVYAAIAMLSREIFGTGESTAEVAPPAMPPAM